MHNSQSELRGNFALQTVYHALCYIKAGSEQKRPIHSCTPQLGDMIKSDLMTLTRLTTALISALGETTEQFALPFEMTPRMKHTVPLLQKMRSLALTSVRFRSSGKAAATSTQYSQMFRC